MAPRTPELLTSHLSWGSSPSRVTSHWDQCSSRVESRVTGVSSRVESSHTKLSSHARVRHYIQYSLESLPITAISGNANQCTERASGFPIPKNRKTRIQLIILGSTDLPSADSALLLLVNGDAILLASYKQGLTMQGLAKAWSNGFRCFSQIAMNVNK